MKVSSVFFTKTFLQKTYALTPKNIDRASLEGARILKVFGVEPYEIVRFRLTLENRLLFHLESPSAYDSFTFTVYKKFNHTYYRLEVAGDKCELKDAAKETLNYFNILVDTIHDSKVSLTFDYQQGINTYIFRLPSKPINPVFFVIGAFIAAFLTGCGFSLLPPETGQFIAQEVFQPLFGLCMGLLGLISILMVFFSVLTGICNIGDINSFSRRGRIIISNFVGSTMLDTALTTIVCMLIFEFTDPGDSISFSIFTDLLHTILTMIPTNPIAPFVDGNAMHVLFLAVGAGILILMNSERTGNLVENIGQINIVIMTGVTQICRLTPIIIYLSVSMMFLNDTLTVVMGTWKIFAIVLLGCILNLIFNMGYVAMKLHKSVIHLLKMGSPLGIIGLTTASSAACLNKVFEICQKEFNINREETGFYFSMLQMFYKTGLGSMMTAYIYIMCTEYTLTLDTTTVIVNILVFTLMGLAIAPVPGGDIPVAIILLNSAGLPSEAIAIYTAIVLPLDMMCTGTRMLMAPSIIAMVHKKIQDM